MSSNRAVLMVVLAALVGPATAFAQDVESNAEQELDEDEAVRLIGEVEDRSTGEPIAQARIVLVTADADSAEVWGGVTDDSGYFRTDLIPLGGYWLIVEALPFAALTEAVAFSEAGVLDLDIDMVPVDYELEPIVVYARRLDRLERSGFYRRMRAQGGTFLTRQDIVEQNAQNVSDLFRMMPGVMVGRDGAGIGGQVVRLRRNCVPEIVVDGIRLAPPVQLDQIASPQDLEGIEVHRGLTGPVRFAGPNSCGRIMLWTRNPGDAGQSIGSLLKVFATAAFVAVAVIATN